METSQRAAALRRPEVETGSPGIVTLGELISCNVIMYHRVHADDH
jgi:hypothetical protein